MADDPYAKWGIDPNSLTSAPNAAPSTGVSENDFTTRWGVGGDTPVSVTPIAAKKEPFTWKDTWPAQIAKTIASGLTLPGDVYQGKASVPQSGGDMSSLPRVVSLAGTIGTGAIPTAIGRPINPLVSPETAQLAQTARETYGIPIRGGQISESNPVRWMDATLSNKPFSGYGANTLDQQTSFNRAVAKTIGADAEKITPEVMDAAKTRLGQNYEDVARQTTIKADDRLGHDFHNIVSDANHTLAPNERSIIHGQISNILEKIKKGDGVIDGETYQALIRTGSPLDRATKSSDTNVKFYAGKVKDSLIDALNRHAPEDMQALLRQTNSQYKAMKTIEPLVEKSTTGDISPALLMGATRNSYGGMAYGGGGELGDLSRIGQRFLKQMPSSGTSERLSAGKLLGIGGLSGAEAGLAFHDPIMAAKLGAIGGAMMGGKALANSLAGSVLRSDWYANRLINSGLSSGRAPNILDRLTNSQIPYAPAPNALMSPRYAPQPMLQYSPENFL